MPHHLERDLGRRLGVLKRASKIGRLFLTLVRNYRLACKATSLQGEARRAAMRERTFRWSTDSLRIFGMEVEIVGRPPEGTTIFVGNHMSYLDILVLLMCTEGAFLAMAEIADWPVIGKAAKVAGTLFVKRDSRSDRARALEETKEVICREGKSVIIFPEGRTGIEGRDWKPGAFRIAQLTGVPMQPFRIVYSPARACAYIDDDVLLPHVWKLLSIPRLHVRVEFGEPRRVGNAQEADAARRAFQTWVQEGVRARLEGLGPLQKETRTDDACGIGSGGPEDEAGRRGTATV